MFGGKYMLHIQELKVSGEDDKSVCLVPVMRWKVVGRTPSL